MRVTDGADVPGFYVLHAAHIVHYREVIDVVVEGIDGEVATQGIAVDVAVDVVAQDAAGIGDGSPLVGPGGVRAAKGRHLDDVAPEINVRQTEPAADEPAIAKQLAHLLRQGAGRDIEVLGLAPQQ